MSMKLTAQVLDMKVGSASRKLVLVCMADIAGKDGTCFPSYQHIADQCEMSKRAVIDHIKQLEADGFVQKQHRKTTKGNSSNIYKITLGHGVNISPPPSENSAPPPSAESAPPSENSAPPPSAESAPRTSHSFEPINEPKEKNVRAKKFTPPTQQEVDQFAAQERLSLTGFFEYYESNGWRVGRNPMKNWQMAAKGWDKRQQQFAPKTKQSVSDHNQQAANEAMRRILAREKANA